MLTAITIKLWEPTPAQSAFMDKSPTVGDFFDLRNLKGEALKKEREKVIRNIPLVRIYGTTSVSGSVDIE